MVLRQFLFNANRGLSDRRFPSSRQRFLSSLPLTIRQVLSTPSQLSPGSPPDHDKSLQIYGWVKSVRKQKRVAFAEIRDGTSNKSLQAVFEPEMARSLATGMSVSLQGELVQTPKSAQPMEMHVKQMEVLGGCDPETYPIQKKSHTNEYLRDQVHLRPRTSSAATILRLRDNVARSFHNFYQAHDFTHVHTPILTSSDCEGAGEVFRVKPDSDPSPPSQTQNSSVTLTQPQQPEFFNTPAFLTVSSQLHLEALATSLSRVYTISPTFRAERSQTNRHLSEFYMLEAEFAFCRTLDEVIDVVEHSVKHVLYDISGTMEEELTSLHDTPAPFESATLPWTSMTGGPWKRITYSKAIDVLSAVPSNQFILPAPKWGESIQSEHEKWLAGEYAKGPIFVTDYPASQKPFYMRSNDASHPTQQTGPTVACFDLLVPGVGELVGGSLREERLEHLEQAIDKHGLSRSDYNWYLDLRKYGTVPHGGFGIGFERFISWISGMENVRECIAFPRWAGRMAG